MMIFPRETLRVFFATFILIGLYCQFTTAGSTDQNGLSRRKRQNDVTGQNAALKGAYRAEIEDQLLELERVEAMIVYRLKGLAEQRDRIQAKKRGIHTQCFLNLVSCYKRR